MHLIEILLPLQDNAGNSFPESYFKEVEQTLTEKFGGITAFNRSPAVGKWKRPQGLLKMR